MCVGLKSYSINRTEHHMTPCYGKQVANVLYPSAHKVTDITWINLKLHVGEKRMRPGYVVITAWLQVWCGELQIGFGEERIGHWVGCVYGGANNGG